MPPSVVCRQSDPSGPMHATTPATNPLPAMQPVYAESVTPSRVSLFFDPSLGLTPVERVMLSSNGSLQRVLSGFYNAPIDVKMVKNVAIPHSDRECVWTVDREIHLVCLGEVLCVATSSLEISDPAFYDLLITKSVGLGQFFRHIGVLPTFQLLKVTKLPAPNNLSRQYTLSCPGVVCTIVESFPCWIGEMDRPDMLHAKVKLSSNVQANGCSDSGCVHHD